MAEHRAGPGRWQLILIASVFFGPLIAAAFLYYNGYFTNPVHGTNHGTLFEPIVNVTDGLAGVGLDELGDGGWILLYENAGNCGESCREALYTIRQARKALGRESARLTRVFLHGDTPPDTLFLDTEHKGLVTTSDASFSKLLHNKRPAELPAGGYYLIDPLGNLVLYFRPEIEPLDMVEDIKHLLRLSRIG